MTAGWIGVLLWCSVMHVVPWSILNKAWWVTVQHCVHVKKNRSLLQCRRCSWHQLGVLCCVVLVKWQASSAFCHKHPIINYDDCCNGASGHIQNQRIIHT